MEKAKRIRNVYRTICVANVNLGNLHSKAFTLIKIALHIFTTNESKAPPLSINISIHFQWLRPIQRIRSHPFMCKSNGNRFFVCIDCVKRTKDFCVCLRCPTPEPSNQRIMCHLHVCDSRNRSTGPNPCQNCISHFQHRGIACSHRVAVLPHFAMGVVRESRNGSNDGRFSPICSCFRRHENGKRNIPSTSHCTSQHDDSGVKI